MKNDVVVPYKPIFYRRFVDDICSRRKLGNGDLFDGLKYYHPNIKLTIKVSPSKFLDILSPSKFTGKTKNYLKRGLPNLQNAINKTQPMVIFIVQKKNHQTLIKEFL